ncbi:MAG: ferritin-like domain-containing protein [bacterium]
MNNVKEELIKMLNSSLQLEHAARIQYLTHAELIIGHDAEMIIERLQEIASDEKKHEETFRNLIGNYLGGEPTMVMGETIQAKDKNDIFEINLKKEKEAIDIYKMTYRKIEDNKENLQYEFEALEHGLRHIIIDEQEHVAELCLLLGK